MNIDRTGLILYTLNYKECVRFYEHILELKIMFTTETLTCFAWGGSYLMVEIDDEFNGSLPKKERTRTCLRLNVANVKQYADLISAKGIKVDYQEHSWGTVAKFYDPDGNLCALKDSERFEKQIGNFIHL